MTHGPEHHIEHAEHAAHAVGDSFNKQVTMSIAIVAAVTACAGMLAHRAHTDTLRVQGEALALQSRASIKSTETANKWAYYQGKNTFNLLAEIMLDSLAVTPVREDRKDEFAKMVKGYEDTVEYYSGDKNHRTRNKVARELAKAGDGHPKKGNAKRKDEPKKKREGHEAEAKKKGDGHVKEGVKNEGKLKHAEQEARELQKETDELMEESKKKIDESDKLHEKTDRFDFGELGLQFGIVLCSLAILTRGRGLWLLGLVSALIGAIVAASGQFGWFMGH